MKIKRGPLFGLYLRLARAGLHFEDLWPRLWPAVGLTGLLLALALFDVLPLLPVWLHAFIVIAFLVAIAGLLQRVVTRVPAVGDTRARHRIETDSGLDHRPLTALDDELAAGSDDPAAQALWTAHRRRMAERAEELRLNLPRAGLTRRDPWAVRAGLVLIVLIGFVAAGNQSVERISRALVPPLDSGAFQQRVAYDVWITPPAYTQVAPIYFGTGERAASPAAAAAARTVRVPAGSTVLVQVSGGGQIPSLLIDETATELNRVEADGYHLETEITEGSRLSLEQKGRELAAWDIEVIADNAPVVTFTAAPETNNELKLRLPFEATDDYGLKSVTASVRRLDGEPIPDGESEITLRLPFPGEGSISAKGKSSHDLTSHVWAGLPVLVHLIAADERGQTGVSAVEPVVLPERHFTHIVARELVEVRKRLKATKQGRLLGTLKLDNISDEPHRFQDNTSAYLAIRVARERLARDKSAGTVSGVQKMLWDIALQLEEGLSALASRDLRAAQEALREALENNASLEELERLIDEVQRALERFLSALMQQLEQNGELPQLDPNTQTMTNEEFQRMLDRARELMRQGNRDAAREMMAQLQRMLESLRGAQARNRQQQRQSREAQEAMRRLQGIIQRQQRLLDDTFRRSQEGETGDAPLEESQEEQESIRRQLGELMQRLGEMMGQVPQNLGQAERSMRQSERALGQGQPSQAVGPQTEALEALRQGAQNAARALARRLGRGNRLGRSGRIGRFQGPELRGLRPGNRDPFGRPAEEDGTTGTATGNVDIPSEAEIQRAREILDELRRRAGDLWRPELELEYIERLLKRF